MAFQNDHFWVLSLDGGGVRALSSLIILRKIMDEAGTEPAKVFTAVAGTSGGGVLAENVRQPRVNARIQAKVPNLQRHTYVVCRKVNQNGELDPSYVALSTKKTDTSINCEVWKAGRATSAAPTYFLPQNIQMQDTQTASYVDGGLGFNNPIHTISDEYKHLGFDVANKRRVCYVSIGTGKPSSEELDRARRFWRRSLKPSLLSTSLQALAWLLPNAPGGQLAGYLNDKDARDAVFDQAMGENAHEHFKLTIQAEGQLHSDTERYFRFNCDKDFDTFDGHHGLSDIALDGHRHLQNIRNVTESYLQREAGQIDQCVRQLQVQAKSIAFVP
ncbi:hypothetical protein FocnCong_v007864 [Fusarium oxysporum f. sp. conglutinans]|nr:hypothetical protein FocnCong_v007864 [Fusarium oxysporum f. sp. conglutinans]